MIFLTNTLSGKKEEFKPIREGEVRMYICGPTVYDLVHIGNLRSFMLADLARRVFEANGYAITQVMNITDIGHLSGDGDDGEDKMTKALIREGKPLSMEAMKELADFYAARFEENLAELNIKKPHTLPKASDHIAEDIELVRILEKKGFAYPTHDGIYFDTSKDPHYGKLGGLPEEDPAHARILVNTEKKNPRDFALWKFNNELGYESPWGKGFPGWHIECSAMSKKYLGDHFDIHTGGVDLAPIHHNNEITQSENASDCTYANYWLHGAFLNIEGEKMAKSQGNFITLKTLKEKNIDPLAYRYWLLTAHYRSPVTFSFEALEAAQNAFRKIKERVADMPDGGKSSSFHVKKFMECANNDLDMPNAVALLWDTLKDPSIDNADKKATVYEFDKVLGLELSKTNSLEVSDEVSTLSKEREIARNEKNWKEADLIRNKIEALGYDIKDTDAGPRIMKK